MNGQGPAAQPPLIDGGQPRIRLRLVLVRITIVVLLITLVLLVGRPRHLDVSLCGASRNGHELLVRYHLLRGENVNEGGECGYTPLIYAASNGHLAIVNLLTRYGANLDQVDDRGNTALIWAAKEGQGGAVASLIGKGAALDHQNAIGDTAIISAMGIGYSKIARQLMDAGANINIENHDGETVLVKAGQRGYGDLVKLFAQRGAIKTNVFIGRSPYPVKPLSPARLWALATTAPLIQFNGDSVELLGSRPSSYRTWAQEMLLDGWGVRSREGAIRMLDWLQETGHRAAYQMKDNWPRRKGSSQVHYLAWDYCRLVWVAGQSYVAGYLTEDEAWARVMTSARALQKNYSSWREMGEDYLRGRERWHKGRDPRFDYIFQLLANPDDPNSPWNKNKWNANLSE